MEANGRRHDYGVLTPSLLPVLGENKRQKTKSENYWYMQRKVFLSLSGEMGREGGAVPS